MDEVLALRILDAWAVQHDQPIKIDYRDFNLKANKTIGIDAADDLYLIEHADKGIRIESDGGYYDQ